MNHLYPPLKPCTTPWNLLLLNIALDHMARGEKNKNEKSRTKTKTKILEPKTWENENNVERNDDLHCPAPKS